MMDLSPFQEFCFKIGRIEVLSVYLDVKYNISGSICQHVVPCRQRTEKRGVQQGSLHLFIYAGKGEGNTEEGS